MRGNHKHRTRGTIPELKDILDRFYATPAGHKMAKSKHVEADIAKAKLVLTKLLSGRSKNVVSSISKGEVTNVVSGDL